MRGKRSHPHQSHVSRAGLGHQRWECWVFKRVAPPDPDLAARRRFNSASCDYVSVGRGGLFCTISFHRCICMVTPRVTQFVYKMYKYHCNIKKVLQKKWIICKQKEHVPESGLISAGSAWTFSWTLPAPCCGLQGQQDHHLSFSSS